jgi:hypothetical protein
LYSEKRERKNNKNKMDMSNIFLRLNFYARFCRLQGGGERRRVYLLVENKKEVK